MSVKTVRISKLGRDYKISPHFKLSEMACKDGSDTVLYSTELMEKLEELRAYGGFTVSINSGYRTKAYNSRIGGASKSQHIRGTAADVVVKKNGQVVDARLICCLCQHLGFKGVAWISYRAVHVDMRTSGIYRGTESKGFGNNVGGDFFKYFGFSLSKIEALKVKEETPTPTPTPTPAPQEPKKETEEDDMKYYKTIDEVPSYYKEAIQKLIDKGVLQGTGGTEINVSEDLCRVMTLLNRLGIFDFKQSQSGDIADFDKRVAAVVIGAMNTI